MSAPEVGRPFLDNIEFELGAVAMRVLVVGENSYESAQGFTEAGHDVIRLIPGNIPFEPLGKITDVSVSLDAIHERADSFDMVLSDRLLPHAPEPNAAVQGLVRLVKPNGYIWLREQHFSIDRLVVFLTRASALPALF